MIFSIILIFLFIIFLNKFQKKFNLFCHNNNKSLHKKIGIDKIPLSGGLYFYVIVMLSSFLNFFHFLNLGFTFQVTVTLFLILGLVIDNGYEIKPKIRLLIQFLIVLLFLFKSKLFLQNTQIFLLDNILKYKFFSYVFTTLCIVILINGINFIDGVNGNSSGYLILVFLSVAYQLYKSQIIIDNLSFYLIIFSIVIFFILNLFDKNYLGGCGNYILGFTISIFIIKIFRENNLYSSLYVVALLWYPAFENLFSIFRKILIDKKNAFIADTFHLHTLIFSYLKKSKFKNSANSLTGLIINIYMIPGFIISNFFSTNSKILFFVIVLNVGVYMLSYFNLKKISLSEKK